MKNTLLTLLTLLIFIGSTFLTSCRKEDPMKAPIKMTNDMDDMDMDDEEEEENDNEEEEEEDDDSTAEDAPNFELISLDGSTVKLADFEGKPLVIFLFGSTCPLCIASAPSIEADINGAYTNEISIIGIDTWNGNNAAVQNFKSNTGTTYDLLLNGASLLSTYSTTYDRLVVIDENGKIAHKGTTSASNDVNQVLSVITELLE